MSGYREQSGMTLNLLPKEPPLLDKASFRTAGKIGVGLIALGAIAGGLMRGCEPNEGMTIALDEIRGLEGKVTGVVELDGSGKRINPDFTLKRVTLNFSSPGDYTVQVVNPAVSLSGKQVTGVNLAPGYSESIHVRSEGRTVTLTSAEGATPQSILEIIYKPDGSDTPASTFIELRSR